MKLNFVLQLDTSKNTAQRGIAIVYVCSSISIDIVAVTLQDFLDILSKL